MFVGVFIECVAWSYWWTWCVLLIIWIYCWSSVPLVSFWSFCFILFLLVNINALKNVFDSKGWSNSKHFSFFVFYFNLSNISSTPTRLLNLYEFYNPPFIKFWRIFQPLSPFIPTPFLLRAQEYAQRWNIFSGTSLIQVKFVFNEIVIMKM